MTMSKVPSLPAATGPTVPPKKQNIARAYLTKQVLLDQLRVRVGSLATSIMARPQDNAKKLKELIDMLDIREEARIKLDMIFLTVQKLVAYSLLEVFKDILPGYAINEKIQEEDEETPGKTKQKLKKETKELREYEANLLKSYKVFLHRLARMLECLKPVKMRKSRFYAEILTSDAAFERIGAVGVRCAAELLIAKPHFNQRRTLIDLLLPVTCHKDEGLSSEACRAFTQLYRNDTLGEMSLDSVKGTCVFIKGRQYNVSVGLLRTFLSLRVQQVSRSAIEERERETERTKKNLENLSKREKKKVKKMRRLENQLLETSAVESRDKKFKYQTEILSLVFMTYFRILKSSLTDERLTQQVQIQSSSAAKSASSRFVTVLSPVLEGLSRFATLINVEFFDDLISLLFALLRGGTLSPRQSLHCLHTVFVVISGEGSSLAVDPHRFYDELYAHILPATDLATGKGNEEEDFDTLLACLDLMLIRRRKQLTSARVVAFARRLSMIALQVEPSRSQALLEIVRQLAVNWRECQALFEGGSGEGTEVQPGATHLPIMAAYGSTSESAGESCLGDPTMWELHFHRRSFASEVTAAAKGLLAMSSDSGFAPHVRNMSERSLHTRTTTYEALYGLEALPMGSLKGPVSSKRKRTYSAANVDFVKSSFDRLAELKAKVRKEKK